MRIDKDFGNSFNAGYFSLKRKDKKKFNLKIMEIFNVSSTQSVQYYRSGKGLMSVAQADKIDALFKTFGIDHPWNEPTIE